MSNSRKRTSPELHHNDLYRALVLNLKRTISESSGLQAFGVPPELAEKLKEFSLKMNLAFALRAGNSFRREGAPKPSKIAEKMSNWGPMKGAIPVDPRLNKLESHADGSILPKSRSKEEVPPDQSSQTHTVSFREIMTGIRLNEYKPHYQYGRLIIEAIENAPDGDNMQFSIDLTRPKELVAAKKQGKKMDYSLFQPEWWKEIQSKMNFEKSLDYTYPVQYKSVEDTEFQDLQIYAAEAKDNGVVPHSGDDDFLWITMPIKTNPGKKPQIYMPIMTNQGDKIDLPLPSAFTETLNTFKRDTLDSRFQRADVFNSRNDGIEELMKSRIALEKWLQEESSHKKISNKHLTKIVATVTRETISALGCITPVESYIISRLNSDLKADESSIFHFVQHGCENHNPKTPSPIDSPMLHVWAGKIYLTRNENELVNFTLQPGFLETNFLEVHTKWKMSEWSRVIERQIELNHPVKAETLAAYEKYKKEPSSFIDEESKAPAMQTTPIPSSLTSSRPLSTPAQTTRHLKIEASPKGSQTTPFPPIPSSPPTPSPPLTPSPPSCTLFSRRAQIQKMLKDFSSESTETFPPPVIRNNKHRRK